MLKSFVASLPCHVSAGATKCDEEETNAILAKYESGRHEFTQRALALAGMDPFPREEDADSTPAENDDDESAARAASSSVSLFLIEFMPHPPSDSPYS